MGRNNTQLRPLTHQYNDPDGLSVRGLGSQAVPGGPTRWMHGTERQKSGPILYLRLKFRRWLVIEISCRHVEDACPTKPEGPIR
jgi:hypothetical protein